MPDLLDQQIGNYQIIELLEAGENTLVYRATEIVHSSPSDGSESAEPRDVMFVLLQSESAHNENFRNQFGREIRNLAQLNHPNIVKILDCGEYKEYPYLVTEYIPARTLKQIGTPMFYVEAAKLLEPIAQALDYAHQMGFIHSDIQPEHILVPENAPPMLNVFGITDLLAKYQSAYPEEFKSRLGNPRYMAPEQLRGKGVDARADIYALGVIFFELITGQSPYPVDSPTEAILQHITNPLPLPGELVKDLPGIVDETITRALAKEPAERFINAAAFATALEHIAQEKWVPPPVDQQTRLDIERRFEQWAYLQSETILPEGTQLLQDEDHERILATHQSARRRTENRRRILGIAYLTILLVLLGVITALGIMQSQSSYTPVAGITTSATAPTLATPSPLPLLATQTVYLNETSPALTQSQTVAAPQFASPSPTDTSTLTPTTIFTHTLTPTTTPTSSATPTPTLTFTHTPTIPPTPTATLRLPVSLDTPLPVSEIISPSNASQVKALARWGKGLGGQIALSQDGKLLAVASSLGVYLYDATTLDEIRFIENNAWVVNLALSPDGKLLAGSTQDKFIKIWQVSDGKLLRTLQKHTNPSSSLVFSPDGALLASSGWYNTISLWKVADGSLLYNFEGHTSTITSLAFAPNGNLLASASEDQTIHLWQVAPQTSDYRQLRILVGHTGGVTSLAFAPDGITLASGSWDHTVRIWQVEDGKLVYMLEGHQQAVTSLAFSPDKTMLASGSWDRTVRLWNAMDGSFITSLEGHVEAIKNLVFSPDSATLISSSEDMVIRLWRMTANGVERYGTLTNAMGGHAGAVRNVEFSPDGAILASAADDSTIRLWHVQSNISSYTTLMQTLEGHNGRVIALDFSPERALLASASEDKTIRLWQLPEWKNTAALEGHTEKITALGFSPDGKLLASVGRDNTLRLWSFRDGNYEGPERVLGANRGASGPALSLAFSPDGQILALGLEQGGIRLLRTADWKDVQLLEGSRAAVQGLAFSPDGRLLASGSADSNISLWDVTSGNLIKSLTGHSATITQVDFSPDGQLLVSASADQSIRLWQIIQGANERNAVYLKTLEGHTADVNWVVFSPDGRLIASASKDGTVRLWGTSK